MKPWRSSLLACLALASASCTDGDALTAFPPERAERPVMPTGIRPEIKELAAELATAKQPLFSKLEYIHRSWSKARSFSASLRDSELLILLEDPSPMVRALAMETIFDRRPLLAKATRARASDGGVLGTRDWPERRGCVRGGSYDVKVQDLFYERLCASTAPEVLALREAMQETNPGARCIADDPNG